MKAQGQRRLAAIMFTDIVGYSALTQRDESLAMALLEEHFQLLRSIFPAYEGVEIKTIGDAFLVEFASALQAANCAIEIQKKLWERNQAEPAERQVNLRIGLHLGDVIHSEGDVFGDGVNIAARIEPCAPPGGIALSEDMARSIRNKLDLPLVELGEQKLKNIEETVRVFAVAVPWLPPETLEAMVKAFRPAPKARTEPAQAAEDRALPRYALAAGIAAVVLVALAAVWFWPAGDSAPERLALLPLAFEGPDDQAATAKMIPALLVESLRESQGLDVTPFDSSRHVPADEEPGRASRELGVDYVLQGGLQIAEDRFAMTLRLRDREGRERWDDQLEGNTDQLLMAAQGAAGAIEKALGTGDTAANPGISRDQEAIRSYLQGKLYLEGWDVESNFEQARQEFAKATTLDPNFGEAYAGLAMATWKTWEETGNASLVSEARTAAEKAVQLAPEHPESYLALGVIQLGQGNSTEAVLAFSKALERARADDALHRRIGEAYAHLDRDAEAEQYYRRAVDLKPDFWQNHSALGNFYLSRAEYEKAKAQYQKVIELRPNSDIGHNNLAAVHLSVGNLEEAKAALEKAIEIQPTFAGFTNLGVVHYSLKEYEKAAEQFRRATELADDVRPWSNLGDAQRQLGKRDEAEQAYRKAIELSEKQLEVNPDNVLARSSLAYSLAGIGSCEAARREISAADLDNRQQPMLHYYAAVAMALCRQDRAAARHIEIAIQGGLVADIRTNPDLGRFLELPPIRRLIGSPGDEPG